MLHAILLGVGAAVAVGCIVAAAVYSISQSRDHTLQEARPRARKIDDEPCILGDCVHCEGAVNVANGYLLECRHAIHWTCAQFLKITLTEVACRICLAPLFNNTQAKSNEGLRKRKISFPSCVTCEKSIEGNPKVLKCSHKMHASCWAQMEKMACPICSVSLVDSKQAESNEGWRERAIRSSTCVTCGESITKNRRILKCSHKMHVSCWAEIEKMACRICVLARSNSTQATFDEGLEKRGINFPSCVTCEKSIEDNPKILKCSHKMHESCWARMEETSTTCPRCMEGAEEY